MVKSKNEVWQFIGVVVALQASYLVWGIMQESIMNTTFNPTPLTPSGKFPSATFCVFSNRVVAVIVAWIACLKVHGTVKSPAPMMSFTPCSISNTLSSWAQYQALLPSPSTLALCSTAHPFRHRQPPSSPSKRRAAKQAF